jgi:methyltransferase (TIGR00027 family)
MRSGKPSRTAQFVAYNRALGNLAPQIPGFSDPLAAALLPERWQRRIRQTQVALSANPKRSPYPRWLHGMGLFNQFRTVLLDRVIADAAPIKQLVILGAGFDTRAWRLQALEDVAVFEVDHPGTQALKRERSADMPAKARQVRFVSTDFREDDMAASLRAAGCDMRRPTFWLWEGVTMYLRPEAVAANLATFASLSASGSHLAMTYLGQDRGRIPRSLLLSLLGEPLRSAYSPSEIADFGKQCGWTCTADSGIEDWLRDLTPDLRLTRRQIGLQWFERIWVAEKSL